MLQGSEERPEDEMDVVLSAFVGALPVGLAVSALFYLSLLESAGRGGRAAVAIYRRRAIATAATAGLLAALVAAAITLAG
jgi:hypothetical protein